MSYIALESYTNHSSGSLTYIISQQRFFETLQEACDHYEGEGFDKVDDNGTICFNKDVGNRNLFILISENELDINPDSMKSFVMITDKVWDRE
jgi:hypothetical protein